MFFFARPHVLRYISLLPFKQISHRTMKPQQALVFNIPHTIIIPSIHVTIPLKVAKVQNQQWMINNQQTGFFGQGTSLPATQGTTVIFAHDKNGLFGYLPLLSRNDTIVVEAGSVSYTYKIFQKVLIDANNVSFIKKTGSNQLAVFTCFGSNNAQRILFLAAFIKKVSLKSTNQALYHI